MRILYLSAHLSQISRFRQTARVLIARQGVSQLTHEQPKPRRERAYFGGRRPEEHARHHRAFAAF